MMTELDFEELDKAVNSAMEKKPNASSDTEPTSQAEMSDDAMPAEQEPSTPSTVSSPAAKRSNGRFMDVMRGPSDSSKKPGAVTPLTVVTPQADETPSPDTKIEEPSEMMTESTSDAQESETVNDSLSDEQQETIVAEPLEQETAPSPFLPGANPEKRPLGGIEKPAEVVEDLIAEAEAPTTKEPEEGEETHKQKAWAPGDPQLATAPAAKPELPAELDGNLVAIESGEIQALNSPPSKETLLSTGKKFVSGSIPAQYKEEESTGDQSHTPIYNTDEAHQPLAHPAKKQPGWLWVVLILAFAIIGCGIGAGIYFLNLV